MIFHQRPTNYKNAGAVHLLAVSGLHIGIWLLLLEFLLRPLERLPKGKLIKLWVMVAFLWVYAIISGLSPSVIRAVTTFSFLAYALNLNRPTNTYNVIALSVVLLLLIDPLHLFQVGFQLSYAAVLGIVWIYPKLQRFWHPKNLVTRKIWQLLSVSLAAQLGVLPLSLYYFHQFPSLFFISNLVIVPFLGTILGFGLIILFLAAGDVAPKFLISAYDTIIGWMNSLIAWVAHQEAFLLSGISFDVVQLVLGYLIVIGLVLACSKPNFKNLAFFMIALCISNAYLNVMRWHQTAIERVTIVHQNRNTGLLYQKGNHLEVISRDSAQMKQLVQNFSIGERIATVTNSDIANHYRTKEHTLFIMDSTAIYPTTNLDYVLLTQSPRIHLQRFIDDTKPMIVIADGSNYKSYVKRWATTCAMNGIPFHYTGYDGALTIGN